MWRERRLNSPYVWGLGQITTIIQSVEWEELIRFLHEVMGFEDLGNIESIRPHVSEHLGMYFRDSIHRLSPTWRFLRVSHEEVWAIGFLPKEVESELNRALGGGKKLIDDGDPFPVQDLNKAIAYFKRQNVRFKTDLPTFDWANRVILEGGGHCDKLCFALIQDAKAPLRPWD